jgi:hypothetical protein
MHSIHQQLKVFYSDAAAAFSSLNAFFNPFRPLCGMNMRVVLPRALCTLTPWMLAGSLSTHLSQICILCAAASSTQPGFFNSRGRDSSRSKILLFRMKSVNGNNI